MITSDKDMSLVPVETRRKCKACKISAWVYPPVSHWAWDSGDAEGNGAGWLAASGHYTDFAGSGVVHLLGGTCALVATFFIGAREGRFNERGKPVDVPGIGRRFDRFDPFVPRGPKNKNPQASLNWRLIAQSGKEIVHFDANYCEL